MKTRDREIQGYHVRREVVERNPDAKAPVSRIRIADEDKESLETKKMGPEKCVTAYIRQSLRSG